jgi:hypothetical protein
MTKTKQATEVIEAKKLNKLVIQKETISDLSVPDAEQIKGGTATVTATVVIKTVIAHTVRSRRNDCSGITYVCA